MTRRVAADSRVCAGAMINVHIDLYHEINQASAPECDCMCGNRCVCERTQSNTDREATQQTGAEVVQPFISAHHWCMSLTKL